MLRSAGARLEREDQYARTSTYVHLDDVTRLGMRGHAEYASTNDVHMLLYRYIYKIKDCIAIHATKLFVVAMTPLTIAVGCDGSNPLPVNLMMRQYYGH